MMRRFTLTLTCIALLLAGIPVGGSSPALARPCAGPTDAACQSRDGSPPPSSAAGPRGVVTAYFTALNAGMTSGDFTALNALYASGARLTQLSPLGQTQVSQGMTAIPGSYRTLRAGSSGYRWVQDSVRVLSKTVILSYDHVTAPSLQTAGRCTTLFVITKGKITSLDWITYYAGVTAR